MEAIFAPLVELIVAIAAAIFEIIVHLLAFVLSSSFVAAHTKGVSRAASIGAAVLGIYLLIALLRGFIPALASPAISVFFSWPAVILALVSAIVLFSLPFAIARVEEAKAAPSAMDGKKPKGIPKVPYFYAYTMAFLLLFGAVSVWSEGTRAPTMQERFCVKIRLRIDPELTAKVEKGIGLLERLTKRELAGKSPCDLGSDGEGN